MNNSDQFRELIEGYALGALDPEERAVVRAHLATGCRECSAALAEAQLLVSQLAYVSPEAAPSELLRGRLLKTVREEARAEKTSADTATRSTIPIWMWGAVAAALLFALYNLNEERTLQQQILKTREILTAQIQSQLKTEQELAIARREALILTDPRSLKISMPANDRKLPVLQATWHQALGIVVNGQELPLPPSGRTLQLWLIPNQLGAKPIPSLTLRPDANGKFALLVASPPDSQGGTKALAITEEPEGGSLVPTTAPIWVGAVAEK